MTGVLCSGCGTLNGTGTKFCIECGTAMSAAPAPSIAATPASSPVRGQPGVSPTAALDFARDLPIGSRARTALTFVAVFAFAFLVYYFASQIMNGHKPINWLNFYVHLAKAMTEGTFDLRKVGLTGGEHPDLFVHEDGVFLPYGPTPALLLIPSVLIFGVNDTTQWLHSMIVGAINVALLWYILRLLRMSLTTQLLIVPFFAFGTANFYSATTGTIWFYNHVVAVMFILLAIIFLLRGSWPFLSAACLGLAMLARQPAVLAVPFFVYIMVRQQHPKVIDWPRVVEGLRFSPALPFLFVNRFVRFGLLEAPWLQDRGSREKVLLFGVSLAPFVFLLFFYNWVRFGDIFETGLDDLYDKYQGQVLTLYLRDVDINDRFAIWDLRNIPLHLYTMFLLPPTFAPPPFADPATWHNATWIRPSEYGMSVFLTSSPFIYAGFVRRHQVLRNASWMVIPLVAIPTLLYFSQGWVQFGYRYLMDYLPFIMILTALGFEENQSRSSFWLKVVLVVASVAIGFWGRYWGTRLGW